MIVSHQEQKYFNGAVMGYKNLPAYIQHKIDYILRLCWNCIQAYINNNIIFSHILEDHLKHFCQVFTLFIEKNISIKPGKSFIDYLLVYLLYQKVDLPGLVTKKEKLQAISKLKFPHILMQLEHYLDLTGWFCEYVKGYAKITKPL